MEVFADCKVGRVRLTPKKLEMVEELAGRGLSIKEIALNIGIGRSAFSLHKDTNPALEEAWERGRAKAKNFVTNRLFELIDEKNAAAIFFYLKTQCGWKETNISDVSGVDGRTLEIHTRHQDIDAILKERFKLVLNKEEKENEHRDESK